MTYELEEPFFEEKGTITAQKQIGGDKTQVTFSSNGTIKGNIEVTNTGDFVSVSKGNKGTSTKGQGVVTTKDGTDKASYTFLQVGKTTEEGKPVLCGCAVWSTDSTGKLAFLDNMLSFYVNNAIEFTEEGSYA
jgi:hypothetical protein